MDIESLGASKNYSDKLNVAYGYNLGRGLLDYRIGLAERTASNPAKIFVLGDSITRGQFTSNEPLTAYAGVLQKILQARYGNSGVGWINALESIFPAGTHARVSVGAGWVQAAGTKSGFGGGYMSSNGAVTPITFNFTGDKVTLVYVKASVGGNANISIDGTPSGTLNCNNATASFNNYQTITGLSSGAHVMTITPTSTATAMLEGIIAEVSESGIQVWKNGMAGYTSGDWNNSNTKTAWAGKPCNLTIIALGINDGGTGSGIELYKTNMDAMVNHFIGLGSSVLLLPLMKGASAWTSAWPEYVQYNYVLAKKYNTALIDMYAAWNKDYDSMQTRGLFGTATEDFTGNSGTNTAHPGDKGHRYIAQILQQFL